MRIQVRNINYKYKIREHLNDMTDEEYNRIKAILPKALNVCIRTFERYMNFEVGDEGDIPTGKLDILAFYFKCKPEDLKNYKLNTVELEKLIDEKAKKGNTYIH